MVIITTMNDGSVVFARFTERVYRKMVSIMFAFKNQPLFGIGDCFEIFRIVQNGETSAPIVISKG